MNKKTMSTKKKWGAVFETKILYFPIFEPQWGQIFHSSLTWVWHFGHWGFNTWPQPGQKAKWSWTGIPQPGHTGTGSS
jgi:hypothetical protein